MKCVSLSTRPRDRRRTRGMTLAEMMVGLGVGMLLMLGIAVIFITSLRSMAGMGNYIVMDQASRNTLDRMTRDIRNAKDLISFATNQLVFNYDGAGTQLIYSYDPASGNLTSSMGGATNTLLTGC